MTEEELYNSLNHYEEPKQSKARELNQALPILTRKMYVWMALALVITGVTAFGVAGSPNLLRAIYTSPAIMWGLIIGEFALVIGVSAGINRLSLGTATFMFILYSVLNGALFSSIFMIYTATSIAKVFFITAGTFGIMAVYGATTKKDLSSIGNICFMALIGLVIATLVNLFLRSAAFDYILSYIGIAIFIGLTAWDTQRMKRILSTQYEVNEGAQKLALLGALNLYMDFINLFLYLLRIFGNSSNH
ncbi:MAG: Bax inhibitor-1/YccA family protein [Prevotella sp.]|jgi:FtsH-binding integral membrane protein|nr:MULTISPECIES: Bax inhibitor-1/YccA family protein [unclassified Prevotella]MCH3970040.1 Bax inhibitor-1/YccA family protein [Prevotella sp.]MCH3985961.1 Bax inhibitor-1/YccA family protein [Prevotella sp.]MCH3991348.1 Bax inhibitor-1/YccA family protein [Prevotella sp.]MCH4018523.1 Bax inhibitor-1/YccA family protein [Prevotella sp.]MCH4100368.1 Bax inhibitor-1/YccA family protein [Prevotella sp.]